MGNCQCSKIPLFIKGNDMVVPIDKSNHPQSDTTTLVQPNLKNDIIHPNKAQVFVALSPNPNQNGFISTPQLGSSLPNNSKQHFQYTSKQAPDTASNFFRVGTVNTPSQDNNSFIRSRANNTEIKRQFTDAHIDLAIIDLNLFNVPNEINIVLLGGIKVGKSALVIKLTEHRFEKLYIPTIAVEIKSKVIQLKDKAIKMNFIVTPGDLQYKENYKVLYEKANFIFLCFDISREGSFDEAKKLLYEEVCEYAGLLKIGVTNFYFIANKMDLPSRKESLNTIQSFCKEHKLDLYEISVKSGKGIKLLMSNVLSKFNEVTTTTINA